VRALPRGWMATAVDELSTYIEKPQANVSVWRWWWQRPQRMAVSAEVATAMGRRLLNNPETGVRDAAACWEGMVRARPQLAEEVAAEEMGRLPQPWGVVSVLRMYQELAALYQKNKPLDPTSTKLTAVVNELFRGKAVAIAENRPAVSQPFHMALAQIFAKQAIWDNGVAGARYQLEETLRDADQRQQREGFFHPLPEIKALLARAYSNIPGQAAQAPGMYLRAAIAYLDTDALDEAARMTNSAPADASAALRHIIQARRTPAKAALPPASGLITTEFLARQRFKIAADLASSGTEEERIGAALTAYNIVSMEHPVLVGTGDVVRWKSVESAMLTSLNAPPSTWVIMPASDPTGSAIRLTIEGENRPLQVPVTADAQLAARVLRTVGVGPFAKMIQSFKLRQGKLSVTTEEPSNQEILIMLRAAGIEVKGVA